MNLRILKKLSKRAAPLLPLLGDSREQFRSEADSYHEDGIVDRKHWDRSHCHPTYEARESQFLNGKGREIVWTTRAGRRIVMRPPSHPRKGTIMVGAVSGYYEPGWDEECAWSALRRCVYDHSTDYEADGKGDVTALLTRRLGSPSEIFRAAADLIASRKASPSPVSSEGESS